VLVSNVAGAAFAAALREWTLARWAIEPEFVATSRAAGGVVNAYAIPSGRGVDRWLAMIGAWRATRGPLLVVSAGTALTIDAVDAGGRHRGGFIVPGMVMMRDALYSRTGGIAAAAALADAAREGIFGVNTAGAVEQGAIVAHAALAERAATELERLAGAPPRRFVTGGDADRLLPWLGASYEPVPDLVLQGLAAVATEPAA
jgi:type III pantothenate kinase